MFRRGSAWLNRDGQRYCGAVSWSSCGNFVVGAGSIEQGHLCGTAGDNRVNGASLHRPQKESHIKPEKDVAQAECDTVKYITVWRVADNTIVHQYVIPFDVMQIAPLTQTCSAGEVYYDNNFASLYLITTIDAISPTANNSRSNGGARVQLQSTTMASTIYLFNSNTGALVDVFIEPKDTAAIEDIQLVSSSRCVLLQDTTCMSPEIRCLKETQLVETFSLSAAINTKEIPTNPPDVRLTPGTDTGTGTGGGACADGVTSYGSMDGSTCTGMDRSADGCTDKISKLSQYPHAYFMTTTAVLFADESLSANEGGISEIATTPSQTCNSGDGDDGATHFSCNTVLYVVTGSSMRDLRLNCFFVEHRNTTPVTADPCLNVRFITKSSISLCQFAETSEPSAASAAPVGTSCHSSLGQTLNKLSRVVSIECMSAAAVRSELAMNRPRGEHTVQVGSITPPQPQPQPLPPPPSAEESNQQQQQQQQQQHHQVRKQQQHHGLKVTTDDGWVMYLTVSHSRCAVNNTKLVQSNSSDRPQPPEQEIDKESPIAATRRDGSDCGEPHFCARVNLQVDHTVHAPSTGMAIPRFQDRSNYVAVLIHKPLGVLSSARDLPTNPRGTVYTVAEHTGCPVKLMHLGLVGRLDGDTSGVMIFTNDGYLNNRILQPITNEDVSCAPDGRMRDDEFVDDLARARVGKSADFEYVKSKEYLLVLLQGKTKYWMKQKKPISENRDSMEAFQTTNPAVADNESLEDFQSKIEVNLNPGTKANAVASANTTHAESVVEMEMEFDLEKFEAEFGQAFQFARGNETFTVQPSLIKVLKRYQDPRFIKGGKMDTGWVIEVLVTIHEGKHKQIRRLAKRAGFHIISLTRRTICGFLSIESVPNPGDWRWLTANEMHRLYSSLSID